jgi:hypothetical protein
MSSAMNKAVPDVDRVGNSSAQVAAVSVTVPPDT